VGDPVVDVVWAGEICEGCHAAKSAPDPQWRQNVQERDAAR
jgi:hypothetical protein